MRPQRPQSTLLSLPTELRQQIYYQSLLGPSIRILFRHSDNHWQLEKGDSPHLKRFAFLTFLSSTSGLLVTHQVKFSSFLVCHQIYTELIDLLFKNVTWDFGVIDREFSAYAAIPLKVRQRIHRIEFRVDGPSLGTHNSVVSLSHVIELLSKSASLDVLSMRVALGDFEIVKKNDWATFVVRGRRQNPYGAAPSPTPSFDGDPDQFSYFPLFHSSTAGPLVEADPYTYDFERPKPNHMAAKLIFKFAWAGLETRLLFHARDVPELFWRELLALAEMHSASVGWVQTGWDFYAGPTGYIKITGKTQRAEYARERFGGVGERLGYMTDGGQ